MKNILFILILLLPLKSFASSYILTCLNEETKFVSNIMVDETNKTIMFISSFNPDTKQRFKVNKLEKIIYWNNGRVATYRMSNAEIPTFKVYNLDKMTYNSSGHYKGDVKPYGQLFVCFKSN